MSDTKKRYRIPHNLESSGSGFNIFTWLWVTVFQHIMNFNDSLCEVLKLVRRNFSNTNTSTFWTWFSSITTTYETSQQRYVNSRRVQCVFPVIASLFVNSRPAFFMCIFLRSTLCKFIADPAELWTLNVPRYNNDIQDCAFVLTSSDFACEYCDPISLKICLRHQYFKPWSRLINLLNT